MTKDEMLESIKQMNVIELSDLVKALEEEFGITAAAPVMMAAAAGGGSGDGESAEAVEDQSEFDVTITEIGPNKINVIKAVPGSHFSGPSRGQRVGGSRSLRS